MKHAPSVTVLMPTFEQARYIERALDSLLAQSLADWEAIVLDDGSDDSSRETLGPYLRDPRLRFQRWEQNRGLGRTLNDGLALARAPFIAYLPSDDVYYRDHLQTLAACLASPSQAVLAFSGLRHHYNRETDGQIPGVALQLVQCMHRRSDARWVERQELESDDLERLFWAKLRRLGPFVGSGRVSCEWVDHPRQRHKLMQEPVGGINLFRRHYRTSEPLRFHTTVGNAIDEAAQYRAQRERPDTPPAADGLKILLVGELAYNADRVLALEERGHRLYGLWMREPYWYNTVGPLPFGHVVDLPSLPSNGWRQAIKRLRPDLIYALLNWQAVPFAHEVLQAARDVPFVWHFKEGPFICLEKGTWPQLVDLHRLADGQIFSSPEMRDWFETVVPGLSHSKPTWVLDGDLPKRDWFAPQRSALLSQHDGEIHTVVPGRPIGLHPPDVAELARLGVHLHFYGDFTHGQWREWIDKTRPLAPGHLHLHANVDQARWVEEFSHYDAGWLHAFTSRNGGELRRADWDDLNYPARLATLAAAGLPMIQKANPGALVATQSLAERLGSGIFFDRLDELAAKLRDSSNLSVVRERVWQQREVFSFDHHVPDLVAFFRRVIDAARKPGRIAAVASKTRES